MDEVSQPINPANIPVAGAVVRAAEYLRMSTDHQRYSTANQSAAIREFAKQRDIEVVSTYSDEGKSGLTFEGRAALKQLLADVLSGAANFTMILVYDVSSWGASKTQTNLPITNIFVAEPA